MTRLNTILSAVFIITAVMAFTSCERNEKMANVMSSGSGIWVIEKIHYTNYDTSGTVILDSVDTGVGEFVFFDSSTLSEL